MSTLPDRSEALAGSCQISSVPYLHRFQFCTGTPPDPPSAGRGRARALAVAAGGR